MRPLILVSSLAMGGAERATVSLVLRAVEAGLQPTVCTLSSRWDGDLARELAEANVDRRDLAAARLASPGALARLLVLLRRGSFDLLHAHGQDATILGRVACKLVRTPLVLSRHVLEEPRADWRQRLRARAALNSARAADRLIAVSSACAEWLADAAVLNRSTVRVVYNGIDLSRFDTAVPAERKQAIRRELCVGRADPLVLLPAMLREGKGHHALIEALPPVLEALPDTRLLFPGEGERHDALRRLARPYGDAIRFLGLRPDMAELMAVSDVVVLPSRSEALPTVLLEAAAAARPVVANDVGGVAEIVEHGATGLLVEPGDVAALARSVVTLLTDRALAEKMGRAARGLAEARFTMDLQFERTFVLWQEAAALR